MLVEPGHSKQQSTTYLPSTYLYMKPFACCTFVCLAALVDPNSAAPNMTQTLGLSLLTSIIDTLGDGASGDEGRRVPVHHPMSDNGVSSEQARLLNKLLGCEVRVFFF